MTEQLDISNQMHLLGNENEDCQVNLDGMGWGWDGDEAVPRSPNGPPTPWVRTKQGSARAAGVRGASSPWARHKGAGLARKE